jgi:hypothetical protein
MTENHDSSVGSMHTFSPDVTGKPLTLNMDERFSRISRSSEAVDVALCKAS